MSIKEMIWSKGVLSMTAAVLTGLGCTAASTAFFTCLIFYVLKDMGLSGALAAASLAVGAYVGAYIYGKFRRHRGILSGMICGAVMYLVIAGVGYLFIGELAGIKKLLLLAFFGAAGGVAGVNSKRPVSFYQ